MKLTIIFFIAACLHLGARGYSQSITLSMKNASLEKVFKSIKRQAAGFNFVYNDDVKAKGMNIDIEVKQADLRTTLNKCFEKLPLTYKIDGNIIVVQVKNPEAKEPIPVLVPIDVTGKVVNENGEPVVATVTVKGTKNAVSTDINGFFVLKGVDENAVLVISGVSVETIEMKVGGRTDLTMINTKTKVIEGEEVLINTGYQKLKPNEMTGSVVQINNELINRSVSTDILTRLQGITSGFQFIKGTENSNIDQRDNIIIRGYSTLFSKKQPLIVLDNFPFEGDINGINPNDVESISVLKDAAASSIWGTKAGNGVIVITTKSGRYNQRAKVSFNSNISIAERPDLYYAPTLRSPEFIDIETFLFNKGFYNADINSNLRPPLTPAIEILLKRRNGQISAADSSIQLDALRELDIRNDMSKYYYSKPLKQQYSLSLSGGGTNQQYFFSVGYDRNLNNTGSYNRLSLNATNTYSLVKKRVEITTGIWFAQTEKEDFPSQAVFDYPYAKIADENGNPLPLAQLRQGYIDTAGGGKLLDWTFYPLKERDYSDIKTKMFNYRINIGIRYKIIKGLEIEAKYLYGKQQTDFRDFKSLETYYARNLINQYTNLSQTSTSLRNPVPIGGILDQKDIEFISHNARGQLNYSLNLNNRHRLTSLIGVEVGEGKTTGNSYRYYGYDINNGSSIPVDFVNSYKDYITGSTSKIFANQSFIGLNDRYVSTYGNAAYVYNNRYSVSVSARRDGSNIFGASTNNKWKPLWSIGGGWEISNESFYTIKWLPHLKARVTYGFQGNVNNSVVALLTINYPGLVNRWNLPFALIVNPPNKDLKWETVGMLNIGLDFSSKNDRVSGSIEYYRKKAKDLLGDQLLAPSAGSPPNNRINSSDMKGNGFDIVLSTKNITGKMSWETRFLFSHSRDEVTNYTATLSSINNYVSGVGGINPIVGRPSSALYSFRWAGLDPLSGDPQGYLNGQVSKNYTAMVNSPNLNDMVYHGPGIAPYFGSLLNKFSWGNLQLSVNVNYKFGHFFRRNSIHYQNLFSGVDQGNKDYLLRWSKPGEEVFTNIPSLVYPANSGVAANRDFFYTNSEILVEKGDNIRLQDIQISYDLNKQTFSKIPIQNIRIYIYASNLGIIWRANKQGIDPDYVPTNYYTSSLPGRTISGGIKIDF